MSVTNVSGLHRLGLYALSLYALSLYASNPCVSNPCALSSGSRLIALYLQWLAVVQAGRESLSGFTASSDCFGVVYCHSPSLDCDFNVCVGWRTPIPCTAA